MPCGSRISDVFGLNIYILLLNYAIYYAFLSIYRYGYVLLCFIDFYWKLDYELVILGSYYSIYDILKAFLTIRFDSASGTFTILIFYILFIFIFIKYI